MPFDTHSGRPPPVYYLADVRTRPSGHALVSPSAPYIRWRRSAGSSESTTVSLAEAALWTAAQLGEFELDAERVLAVPAPFAARLAIRGPGGAGPVLLNHAHLWLALEGNAPAEAA